MVKKQEELTLPLTQISLIVEDWHSAHDHIGRIYFDPCRLQVGEEIEKVFKFKQV